MSLPVLIVAMLIVLLGVAAASWVLLGGGVGGQGVQGHVRNNMKAIVASQRHDDRDNRPKSKESRASIFDTAKENTVQKTSDSKLTIQKRLKYSQWKIAPSAFYSMEALISLLVFSITSVTLQLNIIMQVMTLVIGPIVMNAILDRAMNKRFKAFDADYPQFLLSLVGLLKTGMNPLGAIEASCKGMEEGSLIKAEVEMMLERLRYGVPEDASIGAFAEDVYHPEIELFVQALLLSRRVGGTLSDTLDRLARQVRKRQYFRKQAHAAVGMQRGSIWFIIGIMVALEIYLYLIYPQAVVGAMQDPTGWQVWQGGIGVILLGIYWVRKVTNIRV